MPTRADEYGAWWRGAEGRRLGAAITADVAPVVAALVRGRTGRAVEAGAVLGLAVEALAPPSSLLRGLLSPATSRPLDYFGRSLVNALVRELAWPGVALAAGESLPDAARLRSERRLEAATASVAGTLLPLTPERLRRTLARAVERVIDEAAEGRLSRVHTALAQDEELWRLGWRPDHIRALVNAVIGARPDHARASLAAGFLLDPRWRPAESLPHRRALGDYARRMARAEVRRSEALRARWSAG